jgi:alpha-tubulin suppressor-like RCC1 family protein
LRTYEEAGTCAAGTCSYAEIITPCALGCSGGRCNDPTLRGVITSGWEFNCAVVAGGGVKCWGDNTYGQLGNGTTTANHVAGDVVGLESGVLTVSAGDHHACAVTAAGAVKCWGLNDQGQLGSSAMDPSGMFLLPSSVPVDVTGLSSGIVAVAAGGAHTCALTSTGKVKCWGSAWSLGDGTMDTSVAPVDVVGLSADAVALAAGSSSTCAVLSTGALECWGLSYAGIDGPTSPTSVSLSAIEMPGASAGVIDVSVAMYHTCFTTTSGGVKCWGLNGDGELGSTSVLESLLPVDAFGLYSGMIAVSAGGAHTVALGAKGAVKFWGHGAGAAIPVDMPGLSEGVVAVSAGASEHSCALLASGGARCWGENGFGALGRDPLSLDTSAIPVDVEGL